MISPVFDQNIFKILTLFSISPGSRFTRKEIKEKTILNNIPLDNSLKRLIKSRILKKDGKYYSVNFESEACKELIKVASKQYVQLKEVPLDVYFALVDVSYKLSVYKETGAYLFGSYSKLVYRENSDIDIALLITKKFNKKQFEKLIGRLTKTYKKRIEIHYFDKYAFYKNKKDPLVNEIIKNGVKFS